MSDDLQTNVTLADVVTQARLWVGTPFRHQARLRGIGVDCIGVVIGVARDLSLVAPNFDVSGYPRAPDGRSFSALCRQHMAPVERGAMRPGHVVEIAFDAYPQHVAIVGDYLGGEALSIIHAWSPAGRVVEHRLMFHERMRFVGAYALPGVA